MGSKRDAGAGLLVTQVGQGARSELKIDVLLASRGRASDPPDQQVLTGR